MRGLLGKHLSHSFSKEIHEKIDNNEYNLIEIDDLDSFFQEKAFTALNVTIPYKNDVIKYIDHISKEAEDVGSVNTIVNSNGYLKGYNTDIDGLLFLLEFNNISLQNKVVGILGNGATSRTITYISKILKAKKILVFARSPKENELHISDTNHLNEVEVLFNATPNGMFPHNNDEMLVNLEILLSCKAIIDLVYNPLRTTLLVEAEKMGIKAVNGLMMLVHQAVKANELFNNVTYPKSKTIDIYKEILLSNLNIILIGMPMCGKSYYSKVISNIYNKNLVDIDAEIEANTSMTISQLFDTVGELSFRTIESDAIKHISKTSNLAISTGGGVVLNETNIDYLKQNGLIIFLDMSLKELKQCNPKGRPLLKDPKNIDKLYYERYNLYMKYCDTRVVKRGFKRKITLEKIEVKINEYLST